MRADGLSRSALSQQLLCGCRAPLLCRKNGEGRGKTLAHCPRRPAWRGVGYGLCDISALFYFARRARPFHQICCRGAFTPFGGVFQKKEYICPLLARFCRIYVCFRWHADGRLFPIRDGRRRGVVLYLPNFAVGAFGARRRRVCFRSGAIGAPSFPAAQSRRPHLSV